MEALRGALVHYEFAVDMLKAEIAYLESGSKSAGNLKMLADLKNELVEAESDFASAKRYVDSMKKYAA